MAKSASIPNRPARPGRLSPPIATIRLSVSNNNSMRSSPRSRLTTVGKPELSWSISRKWANGHTVEPDRARQIGQKIVEVVTSRMSIDKRYGSSLDRVGKVVDAMSQ